MTQKTEVVVIGSGPGGYVAAIRASQLGKKVAIVEKEYIGGVCLNVGCIPSKALITAGHKIHDLNDYENFGIEVGPGKVNFEKVQAYKQSAVEQLTSGVKTLLEGNNVEIIEGTASFKDKNTLFIEDKEGQTTELEFEDAIIATGSRPKEIPALPFSDRIIDSTGALNLSEIPESLIVVGGGVIGMELASAYANFGTQITILEGAKNILPSINQRVTNEVKRNIKKRGAKIHTKALVESSEVSEDKVSVTAEIKGKKQTFEAEYALVAIGRTVNTDGINLEEIGVKLTDSGLVDVDEQNRTSVPNIYAIGDIIPGLQLAHKASYEAKVAAEAIAGLKTVNNYHAMPVAVFADPEIAQVGKSEAELKEEGISFIAKRFPFRVNGRAIALRQTDGFVNLIIEEDSKKILGAEIVGPSATDLINEITLAIEAGLTAEDIASTIHPHPTLGEAIMEAADFVLDKPIHVM